MHTTPDVNADEFIDKYETFPVSHHLHSPLPQLVTYSSSRQGIQKTQLIR